MKKFKEDLSSFQILSIIIEICILCRLLKQQLIGEGITLCIESLQRALAIFCGLQKQQQRQLISVSQN